MRHLLQSTCHQPPNTRPCSCPSLGLHGPPVGSPWVHPRTNSVAHESRWAKGVVACPGLQGQVQGPQPGAGPSMLWLGVPPQPPLPQTPPHPAPCPPVPPSSLLASCAHSSGIRAATEASDPAPRAEASRRLLAASASPGSWGHSEGAWGAQWVCWRFLGKNRRKSSAEVPCPPGTCCSSALPQAVCSAPRLSHRGELFPPGWGRVTELSSLWILPSEAMFQAVHP